MVVVARAPSGQQGPINSPPADPWQQAKQQHSLCGVSDRCGWLPVAAKHPTLHVKGLCVCRLLAGLASASGFLVATEAGRRPSKQRLPLCLQLPWEEELPLSYR